MDLISTDVLKSVFTDYLNGREIIGLIRQLGVADVISNETLEDMLISKILNVRLF